MEAGDFVNRTGPVSLKQLLLFCLTTLSFHAALFSPLSKIFNVSALRSGGVTPATLSPLIKPAVSGLIPSDIWCPCSHASQLFLLLPPLAAVSSSSTSVSSNHLTSFQIHPHQLADSVHFSRRAQCSDPGESMADKSMLSLFSMPLLTLIFFPFPCYFAVSEDLNFAQLNRVRFQEQIVAA